MSLRQAYILFCISTSVFYYQEKRKNDDEIIGQLSNHTELNRTWGFWMMYHRLGKLRYLWNHKWVYRVYTSMRLNLRNKRKRWLPARVKAPLLRPTYPNVTWSLDLMHDPLANGKTLRTLNIIDDFNREVLSITVGISLPSQRVIRQLGTLAEWRCRPDTIRSDHGPEFISEALLQGGKKSGVEWVFI